MNSKIPEVLHRNRNKLLALALAVILFAVLSPGPPDWFNQLHWRDPGPGVDFSLISQANSDGPIVSSTGQLTIEIWLVPGFQRTKGNQEIISFHENKQGRPLLLGRYPGGYLLRGHQDNPRGEPKRDAYIGLKDLGLASWKNLRHLAVTVSSEGARLHVNGRPTSLVLPKTIAVESIPFGGNLLLGSSNSGWHSWIGGMLALAIYDRVLEPEELRAHTSDPTRGGDMLLEDSSLLALYRFEEGEGDRTSSSVTRGPDLMFPFRVTRPTLPKYLGWYKYYPGEFGWFEKDVTLNILGFIPLGFLLSWRRRPRFIWIALLVGFSLSLSVEFAQAFIPGRYSSMSDLMSNTAGALLGALLTRFDRSG
jgi:hypothetical protein